MNRNAQPADDPQKIGEVASMMRAFGVLYNTGMTYQTTHAVFLRSVEERMPLFEAALKGASEITIYFSEGQIRFGNASLDAGLSMFRDLAQKFEKMNVSGLTFLPGLSSLDLKKFIGVLATKSNDIRPKGLQTFLDHEGVKTIRERKGRLGLIKETPSAPPSPAEPKAKQTVVSRRADTMTWDIAGGGGGEPEPGPSRNPREPADMGERVFRGFVRDVLHSVEDQQTSTTQAADSISNRFTEILHERIEDVRRESEVKIRRLNTVKDVVLQELESHHLAAIVCDTQRNILACNESGRRIIGSNTTITKGSALEQFIASGLERQVIELEGVPRVAHVILSVEPLSREGAMLISIE
ncbi:MAG: hypothetical protein V2A34_10685 [Lentisphaerota bacterium]